MAGNTRGATAAAAATVNQAGFSLTPYNMGNNILDYSTPEGRKHYDRATEKLNEVKYDCQSDNLRSFLEDLTRRANAFGWSMQATGILQIPKVLNDPTQGYYDLLSNYGEVDFDHLRQYESTIIGQATRAAQDSAQLYNCLMNSLSKEATDTITIWKDDYFLNDHPSGTLLLRVIICESYIDTNVSATAVREKLNSLDLYMATIDSDIAKFNSYVKQQLATLAARGETTQDLLTNLFKEYLACADPIFCRYMEKKQEAHDEGTTIDPNHLMKWAKIKYGIIKEKGLWNAPTREEQQILAMKAEVNNLKKNKDKKRGPKNAQNPTKQNNPQKGKPDWMYHEPNDSELTKPKFWRKFQWWWCGHKTGGKCEEFRRHKPDSCKGPAASVQNRNKMPDQVQSTPIKPTPKRKAQYDKEKEKKPSKHIKLSKALAKATIVAPDQAEDSE